MKKIYHKWDIISDICIYCGMKRRIDALMYKGGEIIPGRRVIKYYVNGDWVEHVPNCTSTKAN